MIPVTDTCLPGLAQAEAARLFPADVAVAAAYPRDDAHDLMPEERDSLPNAVDRRIREFAAGRRAARLAMIDLGLPPRAVPAGRDRAPRWPRGTTGSISHTDRVCVAALARASQFRALGVDIEDDADLPAGVLPEICSPSELAWLSIQPAARRGRLARLIFSAKECAYKCQYAISKALVGFDAFEITPDLEIGQFEATFTQSVRGFGARSRLTGRFSLGQGVIVTAMTYPRAAAKS